MKRHNPRKIRQVKVLTQNILRENSAKMLTIILDPQFDPLPEESQESCDERFKKALNLHNEEFSGYTQENDQVIKRLFEITSKYRKKI